RLRVVPLTTEVEADDVVGDDHVTRRVVDADAAVPVVRAHAAGDQRVPAELDDLRVAGVGGRAVDLGVADHRPLAGAGDGQVALQHGVDQIDEVHRVTVHPAGEPGVSDPDGTHVRVDVALDGGADQQHGSGGRLRVDGVDGDVLVQHAVHRQEAERVPQDDPIGDGGLGELNVGVELAGDPAVERGPGGEKAGAGTHGRVAVDDGALQHAEVVRADDEVARDRHGARDPRAETGDLSVGRCYVAYRHQASGRQPRERGAYRRLSHASWHVMPSLDDAFAV